jgi:hypothetical protein
VNWSAVAPLRYYRKMICEFLYYVRKGKTVFAYWTPIGFVSFSRALGRQLEATGVLITRHPNSEYINKVGLVYIGPPLLAANRRAFGGGI